MFVLYSVCPCSDFGQVMASYKLYYLVSEIEVCTGLNFKAWPGLFFNFMPGPARPVYQLYY